MTSFFDDVISGSTFVHIVKVVTPQKRLVTPFKSNIDQNMLRFGKATLENLQIGKLSLTLATSNFRGLFGMQFDFKSSWFEVQNCFLKEFITKKPRRGQMPSIMFKTKRIVN